MSPEQAAGRAKELTPATDVYALGAVFYELLTGHPPFAGGTTYETIRMLLNTEPRPPRLLNPKIDRDLSTICLKCLEKDPQRRYPAAAGLAEDLERWLKHEPIRAKRSGFFTHGRKWVRRNPSTSVLVALLLALAVGLSVTVWNRKARVVIPKSIAVLPFENLSSDPDNAYFADGIQEEILTRLSSIAELKVISRTSTQRYQSKPRNLGQIAKQLGVANILEGSVQKATNQVRVSVQLINAETDSHLWAETFDRKLTDIFDVESEIAKGIAESLEAKLTGREEQALAVKPTNNPEAYDAYLRGLAFQGRGRHYPEDVAKAASFLERAVQLDPNFALAWARLSRTEASKYSTFGAGSDASKRALDSAQKLAPNAPETRLALGYYQQWVLRDSQAAKATFGRVNKMLPGNSEALLALARISRSLGHWDEAIAYAEQALVLDPHNMELLNEAADTYGELRQFPAALKLYDRMLDVTPNAPILIACKAAIHQAQGNLQEAARLLTEINWQTPDPRSCEVKITQLRLERNYGEAIRLLQARQTQFHFNTEFDKAGDLMTLAEVERLAGDTAGAKANAQQALNTFEPLYKDQPNNGPVLTVLSELYAIMGEKELALKVAEHEVELARAHGSLVETSAKEEMAKILTMVGENNRAISILTELLQVPYFSPRYGPLAITPALLRLDPLWDPLRGDPVFQKLCEEKQGLTTNEH
jgi:TolB-like protein/Tfp pilus assembly protein PilF